jgi:hypothetical protein
MFVVQDIEQEKKIELWYHESADQWPSTNDLVYGQDTIVPEWHKHPSPFIIIHRLWYPLQYRPGPHCHAKKKLNQNIISNKLTICKKKRLLLSY